MKSTLARITVLLLAPLAAHSADSTTTKLLDRQWVAFGASGKPEYKTTPKGDRIMDFSHAGSGNGGTLIELTGEPHGAAFIIEGPGVSLPKETPADTFPIADAYVPAGTLGFSVRDAKGLAAGDTISISWARTAKWIQFMGMDKLVRNGKPQTWISGIKTRHKSLPDTSISPLLQTTIRRTHSTQFVGFCLPPTLLPRHCAS